MTVAAFTFRYSPFNRTPRHNQLFLSMNNHICVLIRINHVFKQLTIKLCPLQGNKKSI